MKFDGLYLSFLERCNLYERLKRIKEDGIGGDEFENEMLKDFDEFEKEVLELKTMTGLSDDDVIALNKQYMDGKLSMDEDGGIHEYD